MSASPEKLACDLFYHAPEAALNSGVTTLCGLAAALAAPGELADLAAEVQSFVRAGGASAPSVLTALGAHFTEPSRPPLWRLAQFCEDSSALFEVPKGEAAYVPVMPALELSVPDQFGRLLVNELYAPLLRHFKTGDRVRFASGAVATIAEVRAQDLTATPVPHAASTITHVLAEQGRRVRDVVAFTHWLLRTPTDATDFNAPLYRLLYGAIDLELSSMDEAQAHAHFLAHPERIGATGDILTANATTQIRANRIGIAYSSDTP